MLKFSKATGVCFIIIAWLLWFAALFPDALVYKDIFNGRTETAPGYECLFYTASPHAWLFPWIALYTIGNLGLLLGLLVAAIRMQVRAPTWLLPFALVGAVSVLFMTKYAQEILWGGYMWAAAMVLNAAGVATVWRHSRPLKATIHPICSSCGYDMRGSEGPCPECGGTEIIQPQT